ncbi:MAG: alpha/beta fold hydrolase, partial [Candidatus Zixiibacteriota bacterium]
MKASRISTCRHGFIRTTVFLLAGAMGTVLVPPEVCGQDQCIRIMAQDSSLDNLVDPPGYRTATPGELGGVIRRGSGPVTMILIPGAGFGADVFQEFMDANTNKYRMFAVTLPGFGGSPAPPCPPETTSLAEQSWTNNAIAGVERLMKDEPIENAVLIGHWLIGTQVAVRCAAAHPDKFKAVILLSGTPIWKLTGTPYEKYYDTPEKRIAAMDTVMAPKWFKTVTRETWDDNNFLPQDYAVNPVRALRLWREAARPPLHVWVRYL